MAEEDLESFKRSVTEQRTPLPRTSEGAHIVTRGADLQWYTPKSNPSRLAPILGLPIRSFEIFMQEIPAGGASDLQQHHHEAVHCVLAGSGYTEIGNERHEWGPGDFVAVPPMEWHRHYNGSETEIVRMLLVENSKLLESLGLNYRVSKGLISYADMLAGEDGEQPPH